MKKCNIVCGGVISDAERTAARVDKTAYTICADSGYAHIDSLGLRADAVLGDFDSFDLKQVREDNVQVFPARKDYTDSEIALMHALELGYTDITILGGLGGRLDHTLGNLHLLRYAKKKGAMATIVDGNTQVWYVEDVHSVRGRRGDILSVIPLSPYGKYTTGGLEYPLDGELLPLTGISNVFTDDLAEVRVENGDFLLVHIQQ